MPDPAEPTGSGSRAFVVRSGEAGTRLDRFLQARAQELSRTRLQALIAEGRVLVGGTRAKPSHRLRAADTVRVDVPPAVAVELRPEAIPLEVVHEDQSLLVVNKPAGLVVHPGPGHDTGTLVHALLWHCGRALSGIGGVRRPGIVHRLDRGTSGLLVVAKTDAAHRHLARQLQARSVERRYLALVYGVPARDEGVIEAAIGRDPRRRLRMAVRRPGEGRVATTRYRVLERFTLPVPLAYLAIRLGTGRTHQIRVHLAHLGHPVVGDPTYRGRRAPPLPPVWAERVAALGGLALHAGSLAFIHPEGGQRHEFEVLLPTAYEALLNAIRQAQRGAAGATPGAKMSRG